MKKFIIQKYKNESLVEEFHEESPSFDEISRKYAQMSNLSSKTEFITKLTLKEDPNTEVFISYDGTFFFFSPEGQEITLDFNIDWLKEPVGAYHSMALQKMDIETIVINNL